mmetsp:Transcript_22429/g.34700  ORF Transcript_22429/g.34700 Transcript_22429/m.34700 type:complete len:192 (-) Transcript_22429:806-1381(-)
MNSAFSTRIKPQATISSLFEAPPEYGFVDKHKARGLWSPCILKPVAEQIVKRLAELTGTTASRVDYNKQPRPRTRQKRNQTIKSQVLKDCRTAIVMLLLNWQAGLNHIGTREKVFSLFYTLNGLLPKEEFRGFEAHPTLTEAPRFYLRGLIAANFSKEDYERLANVIKTDLNILIGILRQNGTTDPTQLFL